jgi:hypothetical protein
MVLNPFILALETTQATVNMVIMCLVGRVMLSKGPWMIMAASAQLVASKSLKISRLLRNVSSPNQLPRMSMDVSRLRHDVV